MVLQGQEKPCWLKDWGLSPKSPKSKQLLKPLYLKEFRGNMEAKDKSISEIKNEKVMQTHHALSLILQLQLFVKKPKDSKKYPQEIITVGDEFKQARLERKLTQHQIAKQLNVNKNFVYELENNKRELTIFALHKVYLFLAYIPKNLKINKTTLQGKLYCYRIKNNLTYSNLAKQIKLDKSTLSNFEKGKICKTETLEMIKKFLQKKQLKILLF